MYVLYVCTVYVVYVCTVYMDVCPVCIYCMHVLHVCMYCMYVLYMYVCMYVCMYQLAEQACHVNNATLSCLRAYRYIPTLLTAVPW